MEIKASSIYDKKTCTAITDAVYPKRKTDAILFSILFIILLTLAIIQMLNSEQELAFAVILAGVVTGTMAFMFLLLPKIQYSSMADSKNARCFYTFHDNEFFVEVSFSDGKIINTSTMKYERIYKIAENSEYIFIFQNKRTLYVIEKSTVADDEIDTLINTLKQYCPTKYTLLKK